MEDPGAYLIIGSSVNYGDGAGVSLVSIPMKSVQAAEREMKKLNEEKNSSYYNLKLEIFIVDCSL